MISNFVRTSHDTDETLTIGRMICSETHSSPTEVWLRDSY